MYDLEIPRWPRGRRQICKNNHGQNDGLGKFRPRRSLQNHSRCCARPSTGARNNALYSRTSYSAALLSGVVSARLSDEHGYELRKDPFGAPQAVKNPVKQLSYVRELGTLPGIWDGVNFKDPNAFPPKPNNWNMWR